MRSEEKAERKLNIKKYRKHSDESLRKWKRRLENEGHIVKTKERIYEIKRVPSKRVGQPRT